MSRHLDLSRWLLDLATWRAPAPRREWTRAMRAEFQELEHGRLSWAIGCLSTRAGWAVAAEAPYLALLVLLSLAADFLVLPVTMLAAPLGPGASGAVMMTASLALPILTALALGAYRSDRILVTAFGVTMIPALTTQIYFWLRNGVPIGSWWGSHATFNMLPPFIGLGLSVATAFLAAKGGAMLRRRAP